MSDGWEVRPLGEVCAIKPAKAEARARLRDTDPVSFVPMEDLGIGVKALIPARTRALGEVSGSYTYFADGDVLLAKITPCFENGKLGVARGLKNGVGFGSSEFIVLRPGPDLEAEFLYYYLARQSFLEEGARSMTGAVGHKRVAKEFIEAYPIPLPLMSEQHRIVAILDEAFEGIATAKAHAEKNLQNVRELLRGFSESTFARLAKTCVTEALGDICTFQRGLTYAKSDEVDFSSNVVLRANNVDLASHRLDFSELRYISDSISVSAAKRVRAGSLLICTASGSKSHLGKVAYIDEDYGYAFGGFMGQLTPRPGVDPRFLFYALTSPAYKGFIAALSDGANINNLKFDDLSRFPVPVPTLQDQRRTVAVFEEISMRLDGLASILRKKEASFDELKQSLLRQAFSGAL